jgi:RiboL-PSP-HEPN
MIEIALEHVRLHSDPSVQKHVEAQLRRFTSANTQKIIQLVGSFDSDWGIKLEKHLVDEYKDAVDSVIDLRHAVAHGRYAGITMARVQGYYDSVKKVVEHIADLCIPN